MGDALSFFKLKFRTKLLLLFFVSVCITWTLSGAVIATSIDERTTIPVTWVISFLGASLAAAFYVGVYIKGVKDALVAIKSASDVAHGLAIAANNAAVQANTTAVQANAEAKETRRETVAAIQSLPCNSSTTVLPRRCKKPI